MTHEPDSVRHLRERVEHAWHVQAKALEAWLQSRGQDNGARDELWANWCVARSTLDRAVSALRAELADRGRLGGTA